MSRPAPSSKPLGATRAGRDPSKLTITTFDTSASRERKVISTNEPEEIRRLALVAARDADDRKAQDVTILDVGDTLTITDLFVICSASNRRLVNTIADSVEEAVKAAGGLAPLSVEGLEESSWVLLDYGGFVVHVFLEETRRFYDLERLFADVPVVPWQL